MNTKITKIDTGFFINVNKEERIYSIDDDSGNMLAYVWRTFRIKQNHVGQFFLTIEYDLQYNPIRNIPNNEKQIIKIYYDNLVGTLTRDMQTIFTDHIEERMQLPFYTNILHVRNL